MSVSTRSQQNEFRLKDRGNFERLAARGNYFYLCLELVTITSIKTQDRRQS